MRTTISSILTLLALAGCSGDGPPVAGDDSGTPQQPSIEFGSTKVTSDENRSVLELPIQLSYALDETLVVPFVVSGSALEGHDVLVLTPSPVKLAAGNLETKILLEIVEDEQAEVDEWSRLALEEVVGARLGADSSLFARIEDDDAEELDESEPNDELGSAQDLGVLPPGRAVHVRGEVTSAVGGDAFDVFGLVAGSDQLLRVVLDLDFPHGDGLVRVLDEAGGLLLLIDGANPGEPEEGTLELEAGTPVFLEVVAPDGGGRYLLQLAGELPGSGA